MGTPVGEMVRYWRTTRRMSQAELADGAEISTRHLSCVECGKARPSREMVLVLASALDVPLRERNLMLASAGYVAVYRESDYEDPALASVRAALDALLRGLEPNGAVVVDRTWNVLAANGAWSTMVSWLLGHRMPKHWNLLRATFDPKGLRPYLANWDAVAAYTLHRVEREARATGDREGLALRDELLAVPGVDPAWGRADWRVPGELLLPLNIEKDGVSLNLFTTLTTFGTPMDVTVSELRVECYFPADDATRALVESIVGPTR